MERMKKKEGGRTPDKSPGPSITGGCRAGFREDTSRAGGGRRIRASGRRPAAAPPVHTGWDAYILPCGAWLALPLIPPSLNQWTRWHWSRRKRYLDQLSENLVVLASARGLPRFSEAVIHITYLFPDRRRRDKDNYNGKFILDALRRAGIITDDNADLISLPEPEFLVDTVYPRTEVWITGGLPASYMSPDGIIKKAKERPESCSTQ